MRHWTARAATDEVFVLAEGPVWDAARNRLLWVDIQAGLVLEGALDADRIVVTRQHAFTEPVGAVAVDAAGRLLVAVGGHLEVMSDDGRREHHAAIVPEGEPRRLNDGKTDPAGRYLVGSRAFVDSSSEVLVRVGSGDVEVVDDDLTLSNGLAWSPDGRLLYSVDTLVGTIWVRDYDASTGAVGERRLFVRVDDGYPDGICTDSDGQLWVAIWNGGQVRCFDPSGVHVGTVDVAAPHTSSVAFAGPGLDVLVITTATDELEDRERTAFPDSGRLFIAHVDRRGTPVPPWNPLA